MEGYMFQRPSQKDAESSLPFKDNTQLKWTKYNK